MRASSFVAVVVPWLVACGGDDGGRGPRTKIFGGDRPAELKTPASIVDGMRYPLLLVLHGFGANGFVQNAYFGTSALPAARDVFVIAPDGTTNSAGRQFWNADPACCDFEGQAPDDVAYLGGLIDDISAEWPIDPGAVFVLGHSNGGYMAYRLACERADAIAAIGSLAGNAATNAAACTPSRAVSVLHLHGTLDDAVPFEGANRSVTQWAAHDGCGTTRTATASLDLDTAVAGAETQGETTAGCPAGVAVDLWTMEGSSHVPALATTFAPTVLDWLLAQAR
jgi:polyhydroxybutyrate depolymerase